MEGFRKHARSEHWEESGRNIEELLDINVRSHLEIVDETGSDEMATAFATYLNNFWPVLERYVEVAVHSIADATHSREVRRWPSRLNVRFLSWQSNVIQHTNAALDLNFGELYVKDTSPGVPADYWALFIQFLRQICVGFYADEYTVAFMRGIPQNFWTIEIQFVQPTFSDLIAEGTSRYGWALTAPAVDMQVNAQRVYVEKERRFKRARGE